jgi:rare lipoprotein A
MASWYGGRWIGRLTANGERYRAADMTAAHKKLPFHTKVRVTDLKTGKHVIVRINNRGPFIKGRIIDLSVVAAKKLGTYDRGIAKVKIEALREIPQIKKPNISKAKAKPSPSPSATPAPKLKAVAKPTPTPKPSPKPMPKTRA